MPPGEDERNFEGVECYFCILANDTKAMAAMSAPAPLPAAFRTKVVGTLRERAWPISGILFDDRSRTAYLIGADTEIVSLVTLRPVESRAQAIELQEEIQDRLLLVDSGEVSLELIVAAYTAVTGIEVEKITDYDVIGRGAA